LGRPVEGRVDDLALDRALHVGDFFGPLVHQHHHQVALGVVLGDRVRDRLHDERLARLGRRHDQAALALADRGHQVDDPGGHVGRLGLQPEPFLRVQRHQLGELRAGLGLLRVQAVDLVQPDQRVELLPALAFPRLPDRALDHVPLAQAVPAHLGQRDIDVVGSRQVAGRADEPVVVQHVQDARDGDEHVVLGDHRLGVAAAFTASPVVVPVAEPVPAPPAALAIPVVVAAALLVAARPGTRVTGIPRVAVLVGTVAGRAGLVVAPGVGLVVTAAVGLVVTAAVGLVVTAAVVPPATAVVPLAIARLLDIVPLRAALADRLTAVSAAAVGFAAESFAAGDIAHAG